MVFTARRRRSRSCANHSARHRSCDHHGLGDFVFVTMGSDHADPSTTYKGKTITVTGKIELYHNVPEIRAKAADVKIQK